MLMNKKRRDPKGSLTQYAYRVIREKILKGEIPLGAPLPRLQLAKEFAMSALPVAAALQLLQSDGLVESLPRIGTRVRVPTSQEVRGHCIVREALESQAARLLAEKCTADERLELQKMAARLDEIFAGPVKHKDHRADYWFQAYRYHMGFHMRIAECTGCLELCAAIERNQVLIFNCLYNNSARVHEFRDPKDWHQLLIEKITSGDPDAAEVAMRRHIRHGMDAIMSRIHSVTFLADLADHSLPESRELMPEVALRSGALPQDRIPSRARSVRTL
jgi:DNA-binding GntR family transcriptional regulator